ncbi:MAG: metallophosphoesterase [Actinomycetota bacterium]|nr:metallophosphoesterase [Actinomycetota bacterium]
MRTAVISDLHLGAVAGRDVARQPGALDRLIDALDGAERIVLLGDVLELRERPVAQLLDCVEPFFGELGQALEGRRVTIVPGNHDHPLVDSWLARLRLAGQKLGSENEWPVGTPESDGPAGVIASWLPKSNVTLAYPGLTLAPGVYATHGHYLDLHLTVPRLESIAASAMARVTGRGADCASADDFEAVLAPLYGFYAGLAQGASPAALERGGAMSRSVWRRVTGNGRVGRLLLGRVTIPAAVAALNRLRIGPFSPELTGTELRRSGLLAMGRVADVLAPEAEHVLFGHTHRPGPLPGDEPAEWLSLSGTRLHNSGNWHVEPSFVSERAEKSPYWPGTVLWVEPGEPPRIENALTGYAAPGAGLRA